MQIDVNASKILINCELIKAYYTQIFTFKNNIFVILIYHNNEHLNDLFHNNIIICVTNYMYKPFSLKDHSVKFDF